MFSLQINCTENENVCRISQQTLSDTSFLKPDEDDQDILGNIKSVVLLYWEVRKGYYSLPPDCKYTINSLKVISYLYKYLNIGILGKCL